MDYEKAYKGARERCRWQLANKLISEECATDLFRDIKESEDERIRKILINIVKGACSKYGIKYKGDEITEEKLLAYLERQKEQQPAE